MAGRMPTSSVTPVGAQWAWPMAWGAGRRQASIPLVCCSSTIRGHDGMIMWPHCSLTRCCCCCCRGGGGGVVVVVVVVVVVEMLNLSSITKACTTSIELKSTCPPDMHSLHSPVLQTTHACS
eukprot:scaffold119390_cov17-Tisochrysis_lutea.AAC.2